MHVLNSYQQIPVYNLEPDEVAGNKHFRVYNFEGNLPNQSELLIPHRKNHYLIVFIRQAAQTRQWIDMEPVLLQDNTVYFTGPNRTIMKEEFKQLWSTGIAFTPEFLSDQGNSALHQLPLIQNPQNGFELVLTDADIVFIEDMLAKINAEYRHPNEWRWRMVAAYLSVLLTYLSRLYTEQYKATETSMDKLLLKSFQAKIEECYRELHEVGDYASLLHISAGHLSEVVKLQSGKPAIKHIHDRLVLEARRLLFHTHHASKEVAYELGFTDASYFNRFFKRETGVTPVEYRANIRKMYH
ncbi:helix-turn-helix domain-containing protein [Mucilaginibacter koreensis]